MVEPRKPTIEVGSRASVTTTKHGDLVGTVKFLGEIRGKTGLWAGIELDTPVGTNNGSFSGTAYFRCAPKHGMFVQSSKVRLLEKAPGITISRQKRHELNPEEKTEEMNLEEATDIREKSRKKLEERKEQIDKKRTELSKLREGEDFEETEQLRQLIEQHEQTIVTGTELAKTLEREKNELAQTLAETETTTQKLHERIKELESDTRNEEIIEHLTFDKEALERNFEELNKELNELKQENEELKDDLELRLLEEAELASEGLQEDSGVSIGDLQVALKKLFTDYQHQKAHYEGQLAELENDLQNLPVLEAKLLQIPELRQELQDKDKELLALKEALEDTVSYAEMIEELTEKTLKQEQENQQLKEALDDMEELHEAEEQLAEEQANIERTLNDEIANKEFEISELDNELLAKDEVISDCEKRINQYRVRICDMENDMQSLKEQLSETGEQEKLNKINKLIDKNVSLNKKVRGMVASDINGKLSEIENRLLDRKMQYLSSAVTPELLERLEFSTFDHVNLLTSVRTKAYLLARELVINHFDLPSEKPQLKWINSLCLICIETFVVLSSLEAKLFDLDYVQYQQLMHKVDWGQMNALSSSVDFFLGKLKEAGLSPTLSLDSFKVSFQEIKLVKEAELIEDSVPIQLIKHLVLLALSIFSLQHLYSVQPAAFAGVNMKDLFQKALSISYKLQFIDITEDVDSYSHFIETFATRYSTVHTLIYGDDSPEQEISDWTHWCEHTENDIKNLSLTPSYKTPVSKTLSPPWASQAESVKAKIAQFGETHKELEETRQNLKLLSTDLAKVQKELNDTRISKKTLESRLTDAHANAQRLNELEKKNTRLQEREKYLEETIESLHVEIEKLQQQVKLLNEAMTFEANNTEITMPGLAPQDSAGRNNPTGALFNRPASSVGQDLVEEYRARIENYQIEKRERAKTYLRSQIRSLPRFEGLLEPAHPELEKIYQCKRQMLDQISTMKVVNLADPEHLQEHRAQREALQSIRDAARRAFRGIPPIATSSEGVPVGSFSIGSGGHVVQASVSLLELKRIQKLLTVS